jgi:hypothetical protein
MLPLQEESPWRYRTFYYSSSPSWHELQQLQVQHHQHIMSAIAPAADSNSNDSAISHADQQQTAVTSSGWVVPVQLQQRLLRRQQALLQLLSAANLQPTADMNMLASAQAVPVGMNSDQQATETRNRSSGCSCTASEAAGFANDPCLHSSSIAQRPRNHSRSCENNSSSIPGLRQQSSCSGLITVHSSANLFEGGTGCHMWDAGFLLAEFVLNNRSLFAGRAQAWCRRHTG